MIRLFFVSLIFIFFSLKVIADPFTREIGIIKEIVEQPIIEVEEEEVHVKIIKVNEDRPADIRSRKW